MLWNQSAQGSHSKRCGLAAYPKTGGRRSEEALCFKLKFELVLILLIASDEKKYLEAGNGVAVLLLLSH